MKRLLYIGIDTDGTTSAMRASKLKGLLPDWHFQTIDMHIPFHQSGRFSRSAGFRFKMGPLITATNSYTLSELKDTSYDLTWVDKAVFLTEETTKKLRSKTRLLIHYTPDTAFYGNQSKHFYRSAQLYDLLVTTKSFEMANYLKLVEPEKVLLTTQGFDKKVHKPGHEFSAKKPAVAFVGLYEPARGRVIQELLNNDVPVKLGGHKWSRFVKKNRANPLLEFVGETIWKHDYANQISSCHFSLGLLSKRFPELHTTRTFEIPACGTCLITEDNEEIRAFYEDDEVIYYTSLPEMIEKITYYQNNLDELGNITSKGMKKVCAGGFSYEAIIQRILSRVL